MMHTGQPFRVERLPGTQTFATVTGPAGLEAPALVLRIDANPRAPIDYKQIAYASSTWGNETRYLLFYFRRLIDLEFPIDVAWLNGYRLLEWHFVRKRAELFRSPEWRTFVARFDNELLPLARPGQSSVRLLEEAALAAHAGVDDRPEAERQRDPRNVMEKTFRVVERMVMTVLNEHPARSGHPVRFDERRVGEEGGNSASTP